MEDLRLISSKESTGQDVIPLLQEEKEELTETFEALKNTYKKIKDSKLGTQQKAENVAKFRQELESFQISLGTEMTLNRNKEQLLMLQGLNKTVVALVEEVSGPAFLNYNAINELKQKGEDPLIKKAIGYLHDYGAEVKINPKIKVDEKLLGLMTVLHELAEKKLIKPGDYTYRLMENLNAKYSTEVTKDELKEFVANINNIKKSLPAPAKDYQTITEIAKTRPEYGLFSKLLSFYREKAASSNPRITYRESVELKKAAEDPNIDVPVVDAKGYEAAWQPLSQMLKSWVKKCSAKDQ
jgi:DNA repair ATPase RecN